MVTEQSKRQLDNTIATLAVEGLHPSPKALHLCNMMSEGNIAVDEAVKGIIEYHLKGKNVENE